MGTLDPGTLERLRGLVEAGRAGGWREVETALDVGDIVIGLRDGGGRGAVKAAEEATGMSHATLWRRVKLALHREAVEGEPRPANLTEALRLVQGLEAEAEAEPAQAKGGRPKKDPLEGLTKRLRDTVGELALRALMPEEGAVGIVREVYAEALAAARRTVASTPRAGFAPETKEAETPSDGLPQAKGSFTTETKTEPPTAGPAELLADKLSFTLETAEPVTDGGDETPPALKAEAAALDAGFEPLRRAYEADRQAERDEEDAFRAGAAVRLSDPKGLPVTIITSCVTGGRVRPEVREARLLELFVGPWRGGERAEYAFKGKRHAGRRRPLARSEVWLEGRGHPFAILRGRGFDIAALNPNGWSGGAVLSWDDVAAKARACGAEFLVDKMHFTAETVEPLTAGGDETPPAPKAKAGVAPKAGSRSARKKPAARTERKRGKRS